MSSSELFRSPFRRPVAAAAALLAVPAVALTVGSGAAHAATNPSCIYTPTDFANALLNALGDPDSSSNVSAILAWEAAEGGNWHNSARFNPLDTTQPLDGSTSINSVGVQAYSSWDVGVAATVDTLTNGYYGGILSALAAGNNADAVANAEAASPWGTPNFSGLIGRPYDPAAPPWETPCSSTAAAFPIYHTIRNANGTWVGWGEVQGAGAAPDFAARAMAISAGPDGSAQMVAIGGDGLLYHTIRNPDGTWTGWGRLQGVGSAPDFAASDVSIAVDPDGSAQVIAIGGDGMLYHCIRNANGTWTGWGELQGVGSAPDFKASAVSITADPDGSAQVIAVGGDGMLYHCIRNADGTWVGWGELQGVGSAPDFKASAVSITADPDGSAQVIAVGGDGMLYHCIRNADGTWVGWGRVQGAGAAPDFAASAVSIAAAPDGSAQVVAVGDDGMVYHCIRNADGTWVGWGEVQGVGSAAGFGAARVGITVDPDGSSQLVATGDR